MAEDNLKFIVDENSGKLVKWLRMLGFNTIFFIGSNDSEMVSLALAENRVLLTRDRQIAKRRVAIVGKLKVITIMSDNLSDQLRQVAVALNLNGFRIQPFTLCLEDNHILVPITKEEVKDRVSPYVFHTQESFVECPKCHRIFWRGTHWQNMRAKIAQFLF